MSGDNVARRQTAQRRNVIDLELRRRKSVHGAALRNFRNLAANGLHGEAQIVRDIRLLHGNVDDRRAFYGLAVGLDDKIQEESRRLLAGGSAFQQQSFMQQNNVLIDNY